MCVYSTSQMITAKFLQIDVKYILILQTSVFSIFVE